MHELRVPQGAPRWSRPTERYHLDILREVCERFIFVDRGRISLHPNFTALEADPRVSAYLGQSA